MEHLTNCHGEWNAAMAALGVLCNLPLVGLWLRGIFTMNHCDGE